LADAKGVYSLVKASGGEVPVQQGAGGGVEACGGGGEWVAVDRGWVGDIDVGGVEDLRGGVVMVGRRVGALATMGTSMVWGGVGSRLLSVTLWMA
jgi:hypothetical protein